MNRCVPRERSPRSAGYYWPAKRRAQGWTAVRSDKLSRANWKSRSSALVPSVFAVAREDRHRVSNRMIPTGKLLLVSCELIISDNNRSTDISRRTVRAREISDVNSFVRRHIIRTARRLIGPTSPGRSIYAAIYFYLNPRDRALYPPSARPSSPVGRGRERRKKFSRKVCYP